MVTTDPEKVGPRVQEVDGRQMLRLLNDCSGAFEPGVLTALVGVSGAGKTTLMDVLAGRKTSASTTAECLFVGDDGACDIEADPMSQAVS